MEEFNDINEAFASLTKRLADIRADALAARITSGIAIDVLLGSSSDPQKLITFMRDASLQAVSTVTVQGPSDYALNVLMLENATERISELFEALAERRGLKIEESPPQTP